MMKICMSKYYFILFCRFIMTNFNPFAKILDENQLSGPNYVDWKRNLIIVLTADKIVHVLNAESPRLALADATKELGGLRYTG